MEEFRNIDEWNPGENYPGSSFVLGRFDGVHLGHRVLIDRAINAGTARGLKSVCFSFQECSYPGASARGVLTTTNEKVEILKEIGIDILINPIFGPPLTDMTPASFIEELLVDRWKAKLIIVGYDFRFGKNREGDSEFLQQEGARLGVEIDIVTPVKIGSEIIKATKIRELVNSGNVARASELLGRPYFAHVTTQTGRGLGRGFGFPTINFSWPQFKVKPHTGIYAVRINSIAANAKSYMGVANFGVQPTIDAENVTAILEVHILEDISELEPIEIDTNFRIDFYDFIRGEQKFDSVEELKSQIAVDCETAREFFSNM